MSALLLMFFLSPALDCRAQVACADTSVIEASLSNTGILTGRINKTETTEYYVQQFKWNKWITVDTLVAEPGYGLGFNIYVPLHSGENWVRIQPGTHGPACVPFWIATVTSTKEKVVLDVRCGLLVYHFSDATYYEIYDKKGQMQMEGYGASVDISSLSKGIYHLNYDNTMTEFIK